MKTTTLILFALFFVNISRGQETLLLKETFDNNSRAWFTNSSKKGGAQVADGKYTLFNLKGKQPLISLQEIPLDQGKEIHISIKTIKGEYGKTYEAGYGIFFGSSDEKNGFLFLGNEYNNFTITQWENGLQKSGFYGINLTETAEKQDNHTLNIIIKPTEWSFFADGRKIMTAVARPFYGNKVGVYAMDVNCSFDDLEITMKDAAPEPCPFPGPKEELVKVLQTVLCSLHNDFADYVGIQINSPSEKVKVWNTRNLSLTGSSSMGFAVNENDKKSTKQFVITYKCPNHFDRENALYLYRQLEEIIRSTKPPCGKYLKYDNVTYYEKESLNLGTGWIAEIDSPENRTIWGNVILNMINDKNEYMIQIGVYGR
jgi:hypothetical protein